MDWFRLYNDYFNVILNASRRTRIFNLSLSKRKQMTLAIKFHNAPLCRCIIHSPFRTRFQPLDKLAIKFCLLALASCRIYNLLSFWRGGGTNHICALLALLRASTAPWKVVKNQHESSVGHISIGQEHFLFVHLKRKKEPQDLRPSRTHFKQIVKMHFPARIIATIESHPIPSICLGGPQKRGRRSNNTCFSPINALAN